MPPLSTIVLFPSRVPSYPDRTLEALVQHEIAHVLIGRATGGRPLPRWFNEGLATVAAREWGLEDRARYALAVIGKGPRTTSELDAAFLGDATAAARAYAMSSAFVRNILHRFGRDSAARILRLVAEGVPFEAAFRQATATSLSRAEAVFFRTDTFWNTWVPFLTSTTALWMAVTLLAFFAIRARRRRDAEIRRKFELDERLEALELRRVGQPSVEDKERLRIN